MKMLLWVSDCCPPGPVRLVVEKWRAEKVLRKSMAQLKAKCPDNSGGAEMLVKTGSARLRCYRAGIAFTGAWCFLIGGRVYLLHLMTSLMGSVDCSSALGKECFQTPLAPIFYCYDLSFRVYIISSLWLCGKEKGRICIPPYLCESNILIRTPPSHFTPPTPSLCRRMGQLWPWQEME